MATKPVTENTINIQEVMQGTVQLNILGTSPMVCNRLSEKTRRELLLPPVAKTRGSRAGLLKHDPIAEYQASPYIVPGGSAIGVMASAFKSAMGTAALDLPGATKTQIGRLVYVEGDYVNIYGVPKLFMRPVRMADINRTPDIRSRAIIPEWACKLTISYVEPIIKQVSVANLLAAAGITAGVGDGRPEKGKLAYGRFKVVNADDPDFVRIMASGGRDAQEQALSSPDTYDSETDELLSWFLPEATARGFDPTVLGESTYGEAA